MTEIEKRNATPTAYEKPCCWVFKAEAASVICGSLENFNEKDLVDEDFVGYSL